MFVYWKCRSILSRDVVHFNYIDGVQAKLGIDLIIWDIACSAKKKSFLQVLYFIQLMRRSHNIGMDIVCLS